MAFLNKESIFLIRSGQRPDVTPNGQLLHDKRLLYEELQSKKVLSFSDIAKLLHHLENEYHL